MRVQQDVTSTATAPLWAGSYPSRATLLSGGVKLDPAQFPGRTQNTVKVGANTAQGATVVPVTGAVNPMPIGTVLAFGNGKFARLTAASGANAASLTVEALPTALVANDTATFAGANSAKFVASGTMVSKQYAEALYGPAAAGDDQFAYVYGDVQDLNIDNDAELYIAGEVRYDRLPVNPGAALLAATKQQFQYTEGQP